VQFHSFLSPSQDRSKWSNIKPRPLYLIERAPIHSRGCLVTRDGPDVSEKTTYLAFLSLSLSDSNHRNFIPYFANPTRLSKLVIYCYYYQQNMYGFSIRFNQCKSVAHYCVLRMQLPMVVRCTPIGSCILNTVRYAATAPC